LRISAITTAIASASTFSDGARTSPGLAARRTRPAGWRRRPGRGRVISVDLQHGEEGLLRDLDVPDHLHALLAFLLLLEQLALAGDVAAVALGR
jgi:hypothetical protein